RRPERERLHAGEEHAQRRVERDREHGGDRHREVLRVRQRLEESALLVDEREHGQERHPDDQEREEDRRTDLLERAQADLVEVALTAARKPLLWPLVLILYLDDGAPTHHTAR